MDALGEGGREGESSGVIHTGTEREEGRGVRPCGVRWDFFGERELNERDCKQKEEESL